jgi:hypothetical protein
MRTSWLSYEKQHLSNDFFVTTCEYRWTAVQFYFNIQVWTR